MENAALTDSTTAASCPALRTAPTFGSSTKTTSEISSWACWVIPTVPVAPLTASHSLVLVKRRVSRFAMVFVEGELDHGRPGRSLMDHHREGGAWLAGVARDVSQPNVAPQRRGMTAARYLPDQPAAVLERGAPPRPAPPGPAGP